MWEKEDKNVYCGVLGKARQGRAGQDQGLAILNDLSGFWGVGAGPGVIEPSREEGEGLGSGWWFCR